jgi:hypothetical protein
MLESSEKSFVEALKADVAETVSLYFAPVRAVVREFNKAISANRQETKTPEQNAAAR